VVGHVRSSLSARALVAFAATNEYSGKTARDELSVNAAVIPRSKSTGSAQAGLNQKIPGGVNLFSGCFDY
jgi:hypothetical protein